jgi:replicative DNA helicase
MAPPHSIEAEQSVLGAVLLSDKVHYAYVIEEGLRPEDFYRERHRVIYQSMLDLYNESEPIDVVTVTEHLRARGELDAAGGPNEIDALTAAVPAVGNLRRYGQIVREMSLLRKLLSATYEIQSSVHNHEHLPRDIVEFAEKAMLEVGRDDRQKDFRRVGEVLHEELDRWHELSTEGRSLTGTPSGFTDLDEITGGFQPGNMIIVAARPSMGKCLKRGALVYDPARGHRRPIEDVVRDVEGGEECFVASLGPDLKLRTTKVTAACRSGRQEVFRLTTKLGRHVEATANHPLLTIRGWRQLSELGPGDRLAVPRRLPMEAPGRIMPDHELVLLAALIAGGCTIKGTPQFSFGADPSVVETVEAAAERSADTFVPDAVFGLADRQISRFLSVLYGCDGHIYAERLRQVGYTTISRRLAEDVQHLLLRLGIVAEIRKLPRPVYEGTGKTAWEVLVTGQEDLRRFVDEVTVGVKTNIDTTPPEGRQLVAATKGHRSWGDVRHVGSRGLSRPRMAQPAEVLEAPALRDLAESDVWWDEVASIEPIGEEETFDIEVPGDHNFVANDVIVHNSALVTNFAENVALNPERPRPVALFSLEMSESELAQRFIASQASIKGDDLRKGRLKDERKWKRVLETAARYDKSPLFVDDSSDIGILEVRAKARRLHQQTMAEYGGLGMVIVDYLQLMRTDARQDNRVQAVGEVSRGLKILARELSVPVIALSQLSRGVESRTDKRPMLSDLRECVTGDTLVVLADGSRTPIADLVGTEPTVLALDETDQLVTAQADAVWPVGKRSIVDVHLASGRRLRCTADHRIRSGAGWSRAEELQPGDRVGLARCLPEPAVTEPWPEDHLVLLGHLVGDGSYVKGRPLRYSTASEENSAAVREAAERAFGARVARHAGRGGWHQLVISDRDPGGVGCWLEGLGIHGNRAHDKHLPAGVFRLPDEQVGLLLRHLWATDGTIWSGARRDGRPIRRLMFSTCSVRLAADVAALLLRLGIVARTVTTTSHDGSALHNVVVAGAEAELAFLDRVGAFGPRVAAAHALRAALAGVRVDANVDTLPMDVWVTVRQATATAGLAPRAMASPSRATVLDHAEHLGSAELAALAANDLFWDRVVDVAPAGEEEVYDLTVPGPECWIADGIVSHNSGQIEQDADLVMFIYRDEYYNENTDRPGEADLIIAKHRNGGLGDVPLTFQGEYPRFLGLQRAA